MATPVVKDAAYVLVHTPDMIRHYGTTCANEEETNPNSEILKKLTQNIRSFTEVVDYAPNQVYIGNLEPAELKKIARPWYNNLLMNSSPQGKSGEIMRQEEFYLLMKLCDAFELVLLEQDFQEIARASLTGKAACPSVIEKLKQGCSLAEIQEKIASGASPLYSQGTLVGCIKAAHQKDKNLSSHVMLENLASKASAVVAFMNLIRISGIDPASIEYVIECSEEACGDMNQRGGGNFAKAVAEIVGATGATGSDLRGFCAAPTHALINAAGLVQAGIYKNVVIVAGGATAKLGMNARDHIHKGLPVLEDCLGGVAILVSNNDGVNPILRTDIVGRHTVGTGSAPQAVMESLITKPLDMVGLKITDIDKYSVEMQNPEITEPAGAGDVPLANYKMIAALGVKRGEIAKTEIPDFIEKHGMPGFVPTQGHIPSGVPFVGIARKMILSGEIDRAMIVGKGSLFLGRMTNLFDGVSIVIEKNHGDKQSEKEYYSSSNAEVKNTVDKKIRVGLTTIGNEHGVGELVKGAELANQKYKDIEVVLLGPKVETCLPCIEAEDENDVRNKIDHLLEKGELDAVVAMHYNFPIGVSTVGRIIAPGTGREFLLATTTGTSATNRIEAMVKNALYGIITAKALGISNPSVGILNVDGAKQVERALLELDLKGYHINFASTIRVDGGCIMRGNDLLKGSADVIVADTLTGNLLIKVFSAFNTGGSYESVGYGYGPGVGENYSKIVCIISRASGAPVISQSIQYAAECARSGLQKIAGVEIAKANNAGLGKYLKVAAEHSERQEEKQEYTGVEKKPVTETIAGIDILELDSAVIFLSKKGIYSESGMGCTGPVILVAEDDCDHTKRILKENGYL